MDQNIIASLLTARGYILFVPLTLTDDDRHTCSSTDFLPLSPSSVNISFAPGKFLLPFSIPTLDPNCPLFDKREILLLKDSRITSSERDLFVS